MKKLICIILSATLLCGCGTETGDEQVAKISKEQITADFEKVLETEYENLNIVCQTVGLPDEDVLQSLSFPVYEHENGITVIEKLELYKDITIPKLFDVDSIDKAYVGDYNSQEIVYDENGNIITATYQYDYDYIYDHFEEFDDAVVISYYDFANYQQMYTTPEGVCTYISQGVLGKLLENHSMFAALGEETVKEYNCYIDDLSDSYMLLDGEKTVAQAKQEMEAYLDAHYPLFTENTGIKNVVHSVTVHRIPDAEQYFFRAVRTLSYNGIPVRLQEDSNMASNENGVMGDACMCESNKVDVTVGFVDGFLTPTVIKSYEEIIPFTEIMDRVAYYLTDDTKFDITRIGLEYRMFMETKEDATYYNWIPYWSVWAENPNDDSTIVMYVDIETGEITSVTK